MAGSRECPSNIWPEIWYNTVPPFEDPEIPIDETPGTEHPKDF